MGVRLVAMVVLGVGVGTVFGEGTTLPAGTQAAATQGGERGTPAGAMNVFEGALESGDVATVADSWNVSRGRMGESARRLVMEDRFRKELGKRFSAGEVERVCTECRIFMTPPSRAYVAGDWLHTLAEPDVALPRSGVKEVQAMVMQRGEDGIWRMGRIVKGPALPAEMQARMAELEERQALEQAERERRYEGVLEGLAAGKYATADKVIHALYPEGSPGEKMRKAQEEQTGAASQP